MIEDVLAGTATWHVETADVLDGLAMLPDGCIDLVFTSPPYNLGVSTGGGMSRSSAKSSRWQSMSLRSGYEDHDDDMPWPEYEAWQKSVLLECWRVLSDTGAIYYVHKPRVQGGVLRTPLQYNPDLPVRQIVIWCRGNGFQFSPTFYRPTHEWIVIFAKPDFKLSNKGLTGSGVGDVWHIQPERNVPDHPAPFPVALPIMALDTTKAEVVLDPFCGSGSTGVACQLRQRRFIGIEVSPQYVQLARQRITREGAAWTQTMDLQEAI